MNTDVESVKSAQVTSCFTGWPVTVSEFENPDETAVFETSQFIPARDGSWLLVDILPDVNTVYVVEIAK